MKRSPLNDESTLAEVLERYAAIAEARQEKAHERSLVREVKHLDEVFRTLAELTSRPLPPIKRLELNSGLREATAVFGLSDVHCEEIVRPGETPYPNEYNPSIADKSIARFWAGAEWLIGMHRQAFKIR